MLGMRVLNHVRITMAREAGLMVLSTLYREVVMIILSIFKIILEAARVYG